MLGGSELRKKNWIRNTKPAFKLWLQEGIDREGFSIPPSLWLRDRNLAHRCEMDSVQISLERNQTYSTLGGKHLLGKACAWGGLQAFKSKLAYYLVLLLCLSSRLQTVQLSPQRTDEGKCTFVLAWSPFWTFQCLWLVSDSPSGAVLQRLLQSTSVSLPIFVISLEHFFFLLPCFHSPPQMFSTRAIQ